MNRDKGDFDYFMKKRLDDALDYSIWWANSASGNEDEEDRTCTTHLEVRNV